MSHLILSDHLKIEHALNETKSFQEIADLLGKARATIVRKVQKHQVASLKVGYHRIANRCIHRRECQLKHVCVKTQCYRQCSTCSLCNEFCSQFEEVCNYLSWLIIGFEELCKTDLKFSFTDKSVR